jgi:ribonuclease VapC
VSNGSGSSGSIIDASALLALLQAEPGQDLVASALDAAGAAISAVNLSEVVAKLRDNDATESDISEVVDGLASNGLEVVAFDEALALASGFLRPVTRAAGLSLGDRACLALGRARGEPVLTADRAWVDVASGMGVEVRLVR